MELSIRQGKEEGEENKIIITLAGSATIGEVKKIKEALLAALADCEDLLLNVEELTAADSSLLQIIHAACRTAENEGKNLVMSGKLSTIFNSAAMLAGFLPENDNEDESV